MRAELLTRVSSCSTLLLGLALVFGCSERDVPDDELHPVKGTEVARIVAAQEALDGAHIPTLDPTTMYQAEIRKALEPGPRCIFRYTSRGKPVLAFDLQPGGEASGGVVKLNGHLVMLVPASSTSEGNGEFRLAAGPVRMAVIPAAKAAVSELGNGQRKEANAIFEVGQSLRVGYRGYLRCTSEPPAISPGHTSER